MTITYRNAVSGLSGSGIIALGAYAGMPRFIAVMYTKNLSGITATFNGQSMTLVNAAQNSWWGYYTYLWLYRVPDSLAAGNYTIALSDSTRSFGAVEIDGIDPTTPTQNLQTYSSQNVTVYSMSTPSIACKPGGAILGSFIFDSSTGPRAVSYNAETVTLCTGGSWNTDAMIFHPQNGGSDVLTVTWTTTAQVGVIQGVALNPYVPATGVTVVFLSDYGVM